MNFALHLNDNICPQHSRFGNIRIIKIHYAVITKRITTLMKPACREEAL